MREWGSHRCQESGREPSVPAPGTGPCFPGTGGLIRCSLGKLRGAGNKELRPGSAQPHPAGPQFLPDREAARVELVKQEPELLGSPQVPSGVSCLPEVDAGSCLFP